MCSIFSLPHCGVSHASHFFPAPQQRQLGVPFLPCFTVESPMCPISSLLHSGVTFCVPFLPCFTVESPVYVCGQWSHLLCPISSLLHCGVSYVSHFFPVPQWSQLSSPPTDKTSSLCSPLTDKTYLSVPHSLTKLISVFPTH